MKLFSMIIGIILVLSINSHPVSANTLTVIPTPDGTVIMTAGKDVHDVERIELTFSYPTEFSGPHIGVHGWEFSDEQMIQDSKPGLLKLALSREGEDLLADSLVLTVTFDVRPANKPVTVQSVTAKYYYTSGDTDSPEVKIRIPKEVKKPVSKPGEPNANTVRGGQLAKPAGWEPGRVKENDNAATPPAASLDRQSGEGFGILAYDACPDPLQPFRDYRGDRKLGELLQLFESGKRCGYRQSPRVAISDGEVKVAVTMEAGADSRQAPNFGVTGGRFLSMHRDGNNWTVELLPDRGEHDVVLYVFSGGMLKRMPLAVAAPLALYLQRLTQEEALPPLLEFTIAANYLATHSPEGSKQGPLASSVNKMRQ